MWRKQLCQSLLDYIARFLRKAAHTPATNSIVTTTIHGFTGTACKSSTSNVALGPAAGVGFVALSVAAPAAILMPIVPAPDVLLTVTRRVLQILAMWVSGYNVLIHQVLVLSSSRYCFISFYLSLISLYSSCCCRVISRQGAGTSTSCCLTSRLFSLLYSNS